VEPAAETCYGVHHFEGVIGAFNLSFPYVKSKVSNILCKHTFTAVKHTLPDEPLMGEPDVAVPISVYHIVACGHING
jgi:hypothetical protein